MHWGLGFDFKIHWKQLAPSLPSPILFRPPSPHTPGPPELSLQSDLKGLRAASAVTLQSCGPQPSACSGPLQDIQLALIAMREEKGSLRVKRKLDDFNDRIRDLS